MSAPKTNGSPSPAWLIAIDPHGRQEWSEAFFSQMAWINKNACRNLRGDANSPKPSKGPLTSKPRNCSAALQQETSHWPCVSVAPLISSI